METIVVRLAKWKMHRFLSNHPEIAKSLPPAAVFTPSSLVTFMENHKSVYIKGNTLHTGKGIIKAWRVPNGYQYIRVSGKAHYSPSAIDLYQEIKKTNPNQMFIIQKAIDLATINGRPYDIRVMMMRDGVRRWQYAGMVAKVHGPGSVISNVRRGGGYVTTVEHALAQSKFDKARIESIKEQLISLSKKIIHYSESYPFFSFQSGIDLAVDKLGKVWIIEVNLHNPSHALFYNLTDKTHYQRIRRLYIDYRKHNKRLL